MLKSKFQNLLKRLGIYERIKASFIYDTFWWFADRSILEMRSNEVKFYRALLGTTPEKLLVFDIGANHGQKTDVFLRLGAQVVAIEPDKSNQEILAQQFLKLRLRPKPVTIIGKAESDKTAVATMWVDAPGSAKNTLSQKWVDTLRNDDERFGNKLEFAGRLEVETTTLEALIEKYGLPFYVKIDVEGHEPSVLRGLKRPIPFLSFEVNLPEFVNEGVECVEILGRIAAQSRFNWSRDCQGTLALSEWVTSAELVKILRDCKESSVEVFWRNS